MAASTLAANAYSGKATKPAGGQTVKRPLQNEVFRNGEAGFVVTEFAYALADAKDTGACPRGMTAGVRGLTETLAKTPAGQMKPGESPQAYERRLTRTVNTAPSGENLCMNPELGGADPGWRMVSGRDVRIDGINLDGYDSTTGKRSTQNTCSHEDFLGADGTRGVDNQFYRMIGCTTGFQSNAQGNGFQIEMYTGSWGILMTLKGVEDLTNDPDVEVGFYANADPIQLSANRAALPFATYAAEQDPRYRAITHGRIVNGVLVIDPVDVRFHNVVNAMKDDRELRGAQIRFKFTPDGGLQGVLAGYTPVENMYDLQFGARHSKNARGELAPLPQRLNTSMGRAGALGNSCMGAYAALYEAADGDRDPKTGRCTSISTQYKVRLAPAFVIDARTQSLNTPLTVR
jgi:hypothetical protein